MDRTREGNGLAGADCMLREAIAKNTNTICVDCKHVLDACTTLIKRSRTVRGYEEIFWCEGFESTEKIV